MKFILPLLATLALVAAAPAANDDLHGTVIPQPKTGACDVSDPSCCASGNSFCDSGYTCFNSPREGVDLCCAPGYKCSDDGVVPVAAKRALEKREGLKQKGRGGTGLTHGSICL
ncbi:hypothetical protein CspeluHIS016_0204440 [Cutaneotrichosporon spelunceum]|uniref:Granulins domain-containing protein n=1 Tax=Cutaneotrichosporon spelunceum TaxID=1672016 RepID=A0AAD3YAU3_9TREE|nr:hypothetical protein CspeluHIS016_0204440 [Cutaneotrichosporon spelunceum]